MKKLSSASMKTLFLLSIVAPVSLLVTFRLTGVLQEPPTPQTITVEAVTWNISRPSDYIAINKLIENSFNNDAISLRFDVHLSSYWEDEPNLGDHLLMRVTATANVSAGFTYSLVVKFSEIDAYAILDILMDEDNIELYNLNVSRVRDWGPPDLGMSGRDAYLVTEGFNQPKQSKLGILVYWFFIDQNNTIHTMTVTLESTFFDGSNYQRVITPIRLEMNVD